MLVRTIDSIRAFLQANLRYCGPPDSPDWQTLMSWHPTWAGRPVERVRVRLSRLNQSLQLQVGLSNRRFYTISWHACVHEPPTPTLAEAMREAVQRQSLDWKRDQVPPHVCVFCASDELLQVDHKDIPFKDIMRAFLETHTAPEVSTWGFNRRSHAPRLPEGPFKRQWRAFHKSRAGFQFLCRSCNARKGARLEKPDNV
jgi:hypothetical protein